MKTRRSAIAIPVAGSVLFIAALLKAHAGPIEGWGLGLHNALVEAEILLALLLLFGVCTVVVLPFATACFGIFGIYSFAKASGGAATCGCFGRFVVNPWITAAMDLLLMIALARATVSDSGLVEQQPSWKVAKRVFATWIGLSIVVMGSSFISTKLVHPRAVKRNDLSALGTVSGNLVVLEPQQWNGKAFALAELIPNGHAIYSGRWVVLLYHNGCSACGRALPAFRNALAREDQGGATVALIELPPHEYNGQGGWGKLNESLPADHDWFATTPLAVAVEDGVVRATVSGEAAIDAEAFLHRAGFHAIR